MNNDTLLKAQQLRAAIRLLAQNLTLTDSERMEIADLYQPWETNKAYAIDTIIRYGVNADNETQLWRVVQAHTSQSGWTPDVAPSLFSKIGFAASGNPIWTQPTGGHDAYQTGDTVEHNGKTWRSTCNGNVWAPGAYGWAEVV